MTKLYRFHDTFVDRPINVPEEELTSEEKEFLDTFSGLLKKQFPDCVINIDPRWSAPSDDDSFAFIIYVDIGEMRTGIVYDIGNKVFEGLNLNDRVWEFIKTYEEAVYWMTCPNYMWKR